MVTTSALVLKIDGSLDYYNRLQLQADLAFQAFVSNSGWFDGKRKRIHLTFEKKKERFRFRSFQSVIGSRRRTFSRQKSVGNETEYLYVKEWW